MKIEWLNNEMTEAIITRGWFRKEQAHVERDTSDDGRFRRMEGDFFVHYQRWFFKETHYYLKDWQSVKLERRRREEGAAAAKQAERVKREGKEWVPVRKKTIPRAQLLSR